MSLKLNNKYFYNLDNEVMGKILEQLEGYIKRTLTNEIAKEEDRGKIEAFINTLNDLIVNNKELENIICLEFAVKNNKIYIVRCSKLFCVNKYKCQFEDCTISDFIGFNPDTSEYLFKKMEEKITQIHPGYLENNTLYDYIEKYLRYDDDLFEVMIINDHIILNEEIENNDTSEIINNYLSNSLKSMTGQKIKDEIHSDQVRNLLNYAIESNFGFIKSMWNIFQETQNYIKKINPVIDHLGEPKGIIDKSNFSSVSFKDRAKDDKKLLNFIDNYQLSKREGEVLIKILEGYTTKDIGDKLFTSPATARSHIQNIFYKTKTHSRIELFFVFNRFDS